MLRSRRRTLTLGGLAALTALTLAAGPASAAITIGAPLNLPANVAAGCERSPSLFGFFGPGSQFTGATSCTWLGADRIANPTWTTQVPRGQWVVVRVRVRAGATVGPMAAVILGNQRSQVGAAGATICCRAMAESGVFTPAPNQVTQIDTRMRAGNTISAATGEPIETVDYLALNVLAAGVALPVHDTGQYTDMGAVRSSAFWPAMRTNQEQALNSGFFGMFPLIQADLEPDADGDGFGDETQDSCATDASIRARPVATAAQCPPPAPVSSTGPVIVPGGPAGPFLAGPGIARDAVSLAGTTTASVPILCPAAAPAACTGTVGARTVARLATRTARVAATARLTLRARPFSVAPGRLGQIALTLPAAARRELARRGRLALDVTVNQTAPSASTTRHRLTVRRLAKIVRAARAGRVTVRVQDLATADAAKGASYDLRLPNGDVIGKRFISPQPGRVRSVTFTLTDEGQAALARRRRLNARIAASYTDAAGNPIGASRPVTLLAPR
ncbi:MAG: hypothetical protein JHC84_06190 [Solirubrobacteraceae bacterium]|nr:hypothetical protein [Solirubrobacteraceae bacterium]